MKINVAIDGPSGAGKSTISDILAAEFGYIHLDTGAMYRATALKALSLGFNMTQEKEIVELINKMDYAQKEDGSIILDGVDVSKDIRQNHISMAASDVSKLPEVRKALVAMQQRMAKNKGYIVDGRDICEVVLPDAEVKIFLTASSTQRAKRRVLQNQQKGIEADYAKILEDIEKRDYQDSHREFSPLHQTEDAVLINSSDLTVEEVVDIIRKLIKEKI